MKKIQALSLGACLVAGVFIIAFNLLPWGEQQFVSLANSFLHGKLYFLSQPLTWNDASFYGGHYFWPLGPFPAVLLVPFVFVCNWLGISFYQGYVNVLFTFGVSFVIYKISQKIGFSRNDSLFLILAFIFCSPYLLVALVPFSWYFAQNITVFLIFLYILEYQSKRRLICLGAILALALMTRFTAGVGVVLLLPLLGGNEKSWAALFAPLLIALSLLLGYNFFRFGNIFEFGYGLQSLPLPELMAFRAKGVFSWQHLTNNLYYLFLATPTHLWQNNPWGTSIFITSPYLVYLLIVKHQKSLLFLMTAMIVSLPILFYYGIGFRQLGYRYALDFFPYLFVALMMGIKEKYGVVPWHFKLIAGIGILSNLYLFSSFI